MNDIIKNIESAQLKAEVPEFRVGDTVRVHALIKEGNRERIQIFEGTVLKRQGGSTRETFTVRKNALDKKISKVSKEGTITTAIVPLFPLWENNYGNKKLERISQSTGSKRKI